MLPFWTNFLIRIYAWIILLSGPGLVNSTLMDLGLIDKPLELLYNQGTIVTGLLYSYLPLMVLPLYAAIEKLDPQLREASANLGAGPARTFRVGDAAADPAGRAHRVPVRVRAELRQLRHSRAARRRRVRSWSAT